VWSRDLPAGTLSNRTTIIVYQPCIWDSVSDTLLGDHLSGKPGNVRDFDSCQEMSGILLEVREVSGKNLVREKLPKLFIVSCIFASILDFDELV